MDNQNEFNDAQQAPKSVADSIVLPPDGWSADPWGRFIERWAEAGKWTSRVRTESAEASDPLPEGGGSEALPDPKGTPDRKSKQAKWAVAAVAAVLLIIGVLVLSGGGDREAESAGENAAGSASNVLPSTTESTTTTTINPSVVKEQLSTAVNTACLAQAPSGGVADPADGWVIAFADIGVDLVKYESLLTACVQKSVETKTQADIAAAAPISVDEVVKNPDAVKGRSFVLVSEITQYDAATGACSFRGYWDNVQHRYNFDYEGDNAYFNAGDKSAVCPVLNGVDQDDVVRLWVRSDGSFSYATQVGGSTTVPSFYVLKAEVIAKK